MKPFVIAASLIVFVCACSSSKNEIDRVLELEPNTDSIYHYTAVLAESSSMNGIKHITTLSIDFSLHCIDRKDSLLTFELVFDKLAEVRKTNDSSKAPKPKPGSISINFNDTANSMMRKYLALQDSIFGKVSNHSLAITCNNDGKVLSVSGFDELQSRIANAVQSDSRTITSILDGPIGPKSITDLLHQSFFYMRKQPIDSGSSWVNNVMLTARAPVKYSNMVNVSRIVGDSVYLDVKSMMSAKTGEEGVVYNQGEQTGTILTSLSSGMPIQMHLTENSLYKADTYDVEKGKTFSLRLLKK